MEPLGSDPARPAAGKSPGTGTFMYPVSPTSIKGHCAGNSRQGSSCTGER